MTLNKSPENYGLSTNFYQHFWEDLREIIFKVIQESVDEEEFTTSMFNYPDP